MTGDKPSSLIAHSPKFTELINILESSKANKRGLKYYKLNKWQQCGAKYRVKDGWFLYRTIVSLELCCCLRTRSRSLYKRPTQANASHKEQKVVAGSAVIRAPLVGPVIVSLSFHLTCKRCVFLRENSLSNRRDN
jgi:hypothetical protein